MKLATALSLGRISNLPTIWTNAIVGLAFAGSLLPWQLTIIVALVFSLFYLAGMYLNDVFDVAWDKAHQSQRPIPAGATTVKEVAGFAAVYLAFAFALLMIFSENRALSIALAIVLLAFIFIYDWQHKNWPRVAPLFMGACRMMVYICAASFIGFFDLSPALTFVALSMLLYIAGITALARAEHENSISGVLPLALLFSPCICALALGYKSTHCILTTLFALAWIMRAVILARSGAATCVPRAIGALLAGITLIDAAFLFSLQYQYAGIFCLFAFITCLLLQKKIAAT